jgi:hypothetical protein
MKQTFLSSMSPALSRRVTDGRAGFESRSDSCFHQAGYARVLALISRMESVGGMGCGSRVEGCEDLMVEEHVEDDNKVTGWGVS